jgi:hypothetical protein
MFKFLIIKFTNEDENRVNIIVKIPNDDNVPLKAYRLSNFGYAYTMMFAKCEKDIGDPIRESYINLQFNRHWYCWCSEVDPESGHGPCGCGCDPYHEGWGGSDDGWVKFEDYEFVDFGKPQ